MSAAPQNTVARVLALTPAELAPTITIAATVPLAVVTTRAGSATRAGWGI